MEGWRRNEHYDAVVPLYLCTLVPFFIIAAVAVLFPPTLDKHVLGRLSPCYCSSEDVGCFNNLTPLLLPGQGERPDVLAEGQPGRELSHHHDCYHPVSAYSTGSLMYFFTARTRLGLSTRAQF